MERPQADDPGPPTPPPPLPPAPSRERGGSGDEERGDLFERLRIEEEGVGGDKEEKREFLDRDAHGVVPHTSIGKELGETYDMKQPESVASAFAVARHRLLPELQAFQVALEDEDDPVQLAQLLDAYECFQKAFEYGVGMKHYPSLITAVRALDYNRIALYMKVFRTLLSFQED